MSNLLSTPLPPTFSSIKPQFLPLSSERPLLSQAPPQVPTFGKNPRTQEPGQTGLPLRASLLCLSPNTCEQLLHLFCLFDSCLWWEADSVVVGSANDSPQCFSCEKQPGPGTLMTKFLHSLHFTPRRLLGILTNQSHRPLRGFLCYLPLGPVRLFWLSAKTPASFFLVLPCLGNITSFPTAHGEVSLNTFWSRGISGCLGKEAGSIRFQSSSPLGSAFLTREERCQVHLILSLVDATGQQPLPEE